jgi:hypothetical protein
MPLYTWRESALIISPFIRDAAKAARRVLPVAVGPSMVTNFDMIIYAKIYIFWFLGGGVIFFSKSRVCFTIWLHLHKIIIAHLQTRNFFRVFF